MVDDDDKIRRKSDPLRDPPLRYLGYANEVGEAFRSQVHVNVVRSSYGVASCYVLADAVHKGLAASKLQWANKDEKLSGTRWAVLDTLIWQGLATVIIPGFTINRICAASNFALRKIRCPVHIQKWISTAAGLISIPFIINPIDRTVDALVETSLRKRIRITPKMDDIITHSRNE